MITWSQFFGFVGTTTSSRRHCRRGRGRTPYLDDLEIAWFAANFDEDEVLPTAERHWRKFVDMAAGAAQQHFEMKKTPVDKQQQEYKKQG